MRIPVLVFGLLCFTACQFTGTPSRVATPADSAAGAVAFDLAGPGGAALLVPVYLNGEGPFDFVLDTGATFTCLDQTLADSLGVPEQRGVIGTGATVSGAGSMRLVGLDSLRIGAAKAFDLTACTLDLAHIEQVGLRVDGLLGLNFLRSFRVTLDFATNTLHLQEP